jgi:aryl-alcohol dehydrogenase-like predicted oxidoreductase
MRRRDFLRSAAAAALAGKAIPHRGWCGEPTSRPAAVPRRPYGKDKVMLSIIGFPGIALDKAPQEAANQAVAAAVERGLNYFDVAPSYGNAQYLLGPALQPFRKDAFLACKTTQRGRDGAERELKGSLEALKTDHFDLYQLHAIQDVNKDVDAAFAKGGAMEVILEAKKAGVIRHVGFSAHSVEAALAALDRYDFDSALFPVNYASWNRGDFGPQIMKAARAKGVTCLALKGMARQVWPEGDPAKKKYTHCWYQPVTDRREASLALRWALSQPITAAIAPGDVSLLPLALDIASNFRPIEKDEVDTLASIAKDWKPVFKHG